MEEYLTVEEAANRMKLSAFTVRQWLKAGKLKGTKLGQRWRVWGSSVEAILSKDIVKPTDTIFHYGKPRISGLILREFECDDEGEILRRWYTTFEALADDIADDISEAITEFGGFYRTRLEAEARAKYHQNKELISFTPLTFAAEKWEEHKMAERLAWSDEQWEEHKRAERLAWEERMRPIWAGTDSSTEREDK